MKLLREALVDVKRLDDEQDENTNDEMDLDLSADEDDTQPEREGDSEQSESDIDGDPVVSSDDDIDLSGDNNPPEENADADSPWGSLPSSGSDSSEEGEPDEAGDGENKDPEADKDIDSVADQATEDPDREGLIRNVKGAHLVYKRQTDDGTYEELWIYNVTTLHDEMTIRRAILSGTDIPPNKPSSPDGKQTYTVWSAGNAEMLTISGLPN